MKAKYFILNWIDGKREIVEGKTASEAMRDAGYGHGALKALDYVSQPFNTREKAQNEIDKIRACSST